MALSEIDRNLLERCLARKPGAWEDFVDRFMGVVVHAVNHTAQSRGLRLPYDDREDLCAEVFLAIVKDDFSTLRNFRGQSSLATYLSVVARRVVVREVLVRKTTGRLNLLPAGDVSDNNPPEEQNGNDLPERVENRDEIERLLGELEERDAQVVRLYHLEGKSYQEISSAVGMPENSVGPTLSRAREKMRQLSAGAAEPK